jgi:hypothetical protein
VAPRRRLPVALVAAVLVATLGLPPTADAGCGGVRTARPKPHQKRNRGRAPLAVGDSVMLLGLEDLARRGYYANARGCRGFEEGLSLLRKRRRRGRLPHLVVLALGADFGISRREVRRALHILGPRRRLGLVTPRESGGGSGRDAVVVREAGRRYPRRVKVLDWVRLSAGHGSWFQADGLHLTYRGAHHFARLLARAIPWAYPHARRKHYRPGRRTVTDLLQP